jgi:hypothetical protein
LPISRRHESKREHNHHEADTPIRYAESRKQCAGHFDLLLQKIREFDEPEGWAHAGAAREKVRVARALPESPKISASFS